MRSAVASASILLLLVTLSGCEWLKKATVRDDAATRPGGPVAPMSANDLVTYLNRQAGTLQSVRYTDVYIDIYAAKEHYTLGDSSLVCAKPRNFLLVGGKRAIGELVHIGSNSQEFWMLTRPPLDQTYVFCSHSDFQQGAGQLPFPFDPDWALQALGMIEYNPNLPYKIDTDEAKRTHSLSFDSATPQGVPIKRVVIFSADQATGKQPQVRRHLILDANNKLMASADIKEVTTMSVGADSTGKPIYAQLPTLIQLEWPQQQFKMELKLRRPTVNERISDTEAGQLFTRPTVKGVQAINLASARFSPSNYRGSTPAEGSSRSFGRR